jgi:DNA-binding CsgD family transcriptional regulator
VSLLPNALTCRVAGLAFAGRVSEALAAVASLPEASADLDQTAVDGYLGRGYVRYIIDDLSGACSDLAAMSTVFRHRGPAYLAVAALQFLSWAEYRLGSWDDAILHGELAASIAENADQLWLLSSAHLSACAPLAGRGDWEAAQVHADAACRAEAIVGLEFASTACAAMAEAHIARAKGDHADVVRALEVLRPLDGVEALREPGIVGWQELYADALVNLGQLIEAEAVLAPYERLAIERDRRSAMARAVRVRGSLESARGRGDEAMAAFMESVAHLEGLPMPFERALTELEYGSLLRRAGKRTAAASRLRAAREGFTILAARPFVERCDRELAACGLAPAKRGHVQANRLTPQEGLVARLVASGKSNREIASELVVSVNTVEYHLGNVYAKLGVHSRSGLVAAMLAPQSDPSKPPRS